MVLSRLKNWLRSRTHVTNLPIKYVLQRCLHTCIQRAMISIHNVYICIYRRLGVLTGAERMPPPGIQAQRPRTRTAPHARHARHDRSMARSSLVARMIFEEMSSVPAARVQRPICLTLFSATLMKRFLTKSCCHGTFKSRPNSFGACIVSSGRGHGKVKVKHIRNFNMF